MITQECYLHTLLYNCFSHPTFRPSFKIIFFLEFLKNAIMFIGTFFFLIFKKSVWTIMWAIIFSGYDIYCMVLCFLFLNHRWTIGHKVFDEYPLSTLEVGGSLFGYSWVHKMLLCQCVKVLRMSKLFWLHGCYFFYLILPLGDGAC